MPHLHQGARRGPKGAGGGMNDELEPHFVSVKSAATFLALNTQTVYALLDQQRIESRYHGRKRLVVVESLRGYAASLPDVKPDRRAS